MVNFKQYSNNFAFEANKFGLSDELISILLKYAQHLNNSGLPIIYSQQHLSHLVGYKYDFLISISNAPNLFYKLWYIKKRNGDLRKIEEPLPSLKEIQNWILKNILNNAVKSHIHPTCKAYIKKRSIKENARFHKKKDIIVGIDIEDFFGSITYIQVYSIFRRLGYCSSVSTLLSKLCVKSKCLPQGAPTSPMLSNLILYHFDKYIFEYSVKKGINYTRYADDLSFSGSFKVAPLISKVTNALKQNGFKVNTQKTKILTKGCSQRVTGIVVNEKIQVPREYRMKIRQEVYFITKFGVYDHLKRTYKHLTPYQYLDSLLGRINFILHINKTDTSMQKYLEYIRSIKKQL